MKYSNLYPMWATTNSTRISKLKLRIYIYIYYLHVQSFISLITQYTKYKRKCNLSYITPTTHELKNDQTIVIFSNPSVYLEFSIVMKYN